MSGERVTLLTALVVAAVSYGLIEARVGGLLVWQLGLVVSMMALIALGADWLVDAACRIAAGLGISRLVIGLTVVALGTSAPEIAASLVAGFQGHSEITIANVIGSNIFNTCFILGGVAMLLQKGLSVDRPLVTRDGGMLLVGTAALFLFVGALETKAAPDGAGFWPAVLNLRLERMEGLVLTGALVAYLYWLYHSRGGDAEALEAEKRQSIESFGHSSWRDGPLLLVGLAAVVGGCHVLVGQAHTVDGELHGHGALWFAALWELPEYIVGATIIAAGTSAPEFVVSLVAAARGAHGLSAGNIMGSNIFNTLGVVGIAGLLLQPPVAEPVRLSGAVVPSLAGFGLIALIALVMMWRGLRLTRVEGGLLVLLGVLRWVLDFVFRGAV